MASKCSFTTRKLRFFGHFCLVLAASPTFFNGLLRLWLVSVGFAMIRTPSLQLDHLGIFRRWRPERMGRQFDAADLLAEHDDAADMTLFAGDGELEAIHPRQAPAPAGIGQERDLAQRDVAVEQFDIGFRAVLFDLRQGPLAQTVSVPQPAAGRGQQHQNENITEGQHCGAPDGHGRSWLTPVMARRHSASLTSSCLAWSISLRLSVPGSVARVPGESCGAGGPG